jgi:hypothetical protein
VTAGFDAIGARSVHARAGHGIRGSMNNKLDVSRRLAIGGMTCLASTLLAARIGQALAQQKVSKIEAKYQDHATGQQRCSICLQFRPPGTCEIVAGPVSPGGWCQFFAARENAR